MRLNTLNTKIDLSKGYYQIPIKAEHKYITAFHSELGLRQLKCMPFGLNKAGAVVCRMIRKLLKGIANLGSYIDDLVIHTPNWDGHSEAVRNVLDQLRIHSLTARPPKCEIGCKEIKLLSQVVGQGVVKPQDEKVDRVLNVTKPSTKKELISFLGMVGYYRKYINRFAELAKPLTYMTKKKEPNILNWNDNAENAYDLLKTKISERPMIRLPQFDKAMVLCTDASNVGIGAMLMQEFEEGRFPIAYASRTLNTAETHYYVIERECLALVWVMKTISSLLVWAGVCDRVRS